VRWRLGRPAAPGVRPVSRGLNGDRGDRRVEPCNTEVLSFMSEVQADSGVKEDVRNLASEADAEVGAQKQSFGQISLESG
jgi:hypothetical protein